MIILLQFLIILCVESKTTHADKYELHDSGIINNENCKLPNFPAFSKELRHIVRALPYYNCSHYGPLTYTLVKNNKAYLDIIYENVPYYYGPLTPVCCFSYVRRNGSKHLPDYGISYSTCKYFNSRTELEEYTVVVKCTLKDNVVYRNAHTVIVISKPIEKKINSLKKTLRLQNKRHLSVLFIVIDGISRLSFSRNMPRTRHYLLQNNFKEFVAYNKIADNTFPNFIALLTGLDPKQTTQCNLNNVGQLEHCPMIWYDFRDRGFATAYAEDYIDIITFLHKGFINTPTDYYFKPYMIAAEKLGISYKDTMPYCAGNMSEGERILNTGLDFAVTFKNQPSFGIFWMNTFSHNNVNSPSRFDKVMKTFFKDLKSHKILNESFVVLTSDHGIRNGNIRQTIQGWYEERLPNNFISVPSWFSTAFPDKYQNFLENSKKLVSTYDLYMTLQDILSNNDDNYQVKLSQRCPHCRSIFSKIPTNRSCYEAGISEAWCTCIDKLDKHHPDLTPKVNKEAMGFILAAKILGSYEKPTNIFSTSLSYFQGNSYYVVNFKTKKFKYVTTLQGTINPITFKKLLFNFKLA